MADFLTRLAMRIGEPEGFVRPRLPSLFEPSHLDPVLPAGAEAALTEFRAASLESGSEDARDESIHGVEASVASDARPADAQPGPRLSRERKQSRSARPAERALEADAPYLETPAAARTKQSAPLPMRPPLPPGPQVDPVEAGPPPARRSNVLLTATERPVAPPPTTIFPPRWERMAASAAQVPPLIAGERPVVLPAPTTQRSAQQSDILRPRIADRTAARSIKNEQTSEPTIHVTIGRIDVRAVTPTAPTSRKAADASPVMSLEEYLRTRAR